MCKAVEGYKRMVVGRKLSDIFDNFGKFWQEITQEPQMRWVCNSAWSWIICRVIWCCWFDFPSVGPRERSDALGCGCHLEFLVGFMGKDGGEGLLNLTPLIFQSLREPILIVFLNPLNALHFSAYLKPVWKLLADMVSVLNFLVNLFLVSSEFWEQ